MPKTSSNTVNFLCSRLFAKFFCLSIKVSGLLFFTLVLWGCKPKKELPSQQSFLVEKEYRPAMVFIESGHFMMGSPEKKHPLHFSHGNASNEYYHRVKLSSFYMAETELTWGQLITAMEQDKTFNSYMQKMYNPTKSKHELSGPITQSALHRFNKTSRFPTIAKWDVGINYCNAISRIEGRTPCYLPFLGYCNYKANGYRLSTDAEWEYAARAGTKGYNFWIKDMDIKYGKTTGTPIFDTTLSNKYAWTKFNSKQLHIVKALLPNAWGLYDMIGNADEWCNDYFSYYYSYFAPDSINPRLSSRLFMTRNKEFLYDNSCNGKYLLSSPT